MEKFKKSVRVGDLSADYEYQRPINPASVKKILKEFDPILVETLKVSLRPDGMMMVMDGNHTRTALEEKFGADYFCDAEIYVGLTKEQEAWYFEKFNTGKKKVPYNDILKSRIAQGNPIAVAYENTLKSSGIKYAWNNSKTTRKIFVAHASGLRVFEKYGKDVLLKSLKTIIEVDNQSYYSGRILAGLCVLFFCNEHIDWERMVSSLQATNIYKIQGIASNYGTVDSGASSTVYARAIADIYNKNLRKGKIQVKKAR